jgi:hypothetical protein
MGRYINNDLCNSKYIQDSYSELIKILLPGIIVEYFELTPSKRKMKSSTFT